MKKLNILLIIICVWLSFGFVKNTLAIDAIQIPVKGKITLVDITSDHCKSCEKMLPVMEKLKQNYSHKIEIITVDFWKHPEIVKKIGTNTSPTILIFDKSGNEVFRDYGYITEEKIEFHLKKLL